jgi:hypothetical protein
MHVAMMLMLPCFLVLQRFFKSIAMRYRFLLFSNLHLNLLMMLFPVFTSFYVIGLSLCFSMIICVQSVAGCRLSECHIEMEFVHCILNELYIQMVF